MAIDPRQLSYLLAIAEHGSFVRAAQVEGLSQPALSNSIAVLERRLGVKVLERSRRGSSLTNFGEILVRRAKGLKALLAQAEEEVRLRNAGAEGPLTIGATASVLPKLLPEALAILCAMTGKIEVSIIDGVEDQLVAALRSGELDLVVGPVVGTLPMTDDIVEQALIDDPFSIGVGSKSIYAGKASLTLNELRDAPWVLPRPGTTFSRRVQAFFLTSDVGWPLDCITTNSPALVRALVRNTDRVTIISRLQVSDSDIGLTQVPLAGAGSRKIGYKIRRDAQLSPIGEHFIAALRQAVERQPAAFR